jgi:hypothetical protein
MLTWLSPLLAAAEAVAKWALEINLGAGVEAQRRD